MTIGFVPRPQSGLTMGYGWALSSGQWSLIGWCERVGAMTEIVMENSRFIWRVVWLVLRTSWLRSIVAL